MEIGQSSIKLETLSWVLLALALVSSLVEGLTVNKDVDLIVLMCAITAGWAFSISHGIARYGFKDMLVFFVISGVVSNIYENLSIFTGFPFGSYHYTDRFGPKLIEAPYFLAIGYIFVVYVGWQTAHVVVQHFSNKLERHWLVVIPILTAIFTVMNDLCFDPFFSTVQQRYIWHDGGAFFGVPFVNYLGWYLCIYTVAQLFAIYIWKKNKSVATVEGNNGLTSKSSAVSNLKCTE